MWHSRENFKTNLKLGNKYSVPEKNLDQICVAAWENRTDVAKEKWVGLQYQLSYS